MITKMQHDKFLKRIQQPTMPNKCWIWIGAKDPLGYGIFHNVSHRINAHRMQYQIYNSIILPKGIVVDHLCRNHLCVNPDHLDAVTIAENVLRGEGNAAQNLKKTHCIKGHPFAGSNLRTDGRHRRCKKCRQAYDKKRRSKVSVSFETEVSPQQQTEDK